MQSDIHSTCHIFQPSGIIVCKEYHPSPFPSHLLRLREISSVILPKSSSLQKFHPSTFLNHRHQRISSINAPKSSSSQGKSSTFANHSQEYPLSTFPNRRVQGISSLNLPKSSSARNITPQPSQITVCKEYLPQTLRHSDSTSSFKAALKTHLFNNYL